MTTKQPIEPAIMAVFHEPHPLTGDAVPIMRIVNDRTTVADLVDWHRRNNTTPANWKRSWFNMRLICEQP